MGTCDYCKSDRRHSNTQSEVEYCDKKRIREEMKFFVHFFCLLIVPFAESCVSRDLGWLTSLQEAGHEGCPTSCLAICQASNYARESNCTFNQATGFFFSGSTVTTKACNNCSCGNIGRGGDYCGACYYCGCSHYCRSICCDHNSSNNYNHNNHYYYYYYYYNNYNDYNNHNHINYNNDHYFYDNYNNYNHNCNDYNNHNQKLCNNNFCCNNGKQRITRKKIN